MIITFDFDCTLTHPQFDHENELWTESLSPNLIMINQLKQEALLATIWIVTSRSPNHVRDVERLIAQHLLPVMGIIATDGKDKGPFLKELGSIKHFDDCPQEWEDSKFVWKGIWIKVPHPTDHLFAGESDGVPCDSRT